MPKRLGLGKTYCPKCGWNVAVVAVENCGDPFCNCTDCGHKFRASEGFKEDPKKKEI